MKKYSTAILLGFFGAMVLAAPALAATNVSFTPVSVNVAQGQTFNLTIGINPQGVKNYSVKTELRYPADLLEIKSFTFANGWMAVSQSGYDLIDNTNGVLIKTAGYPGGAASAVAFGTASFFAKKSGSGTIVLSDNSFALDANNQNVLSGTPKATFVVTAPVAPKNPTNSNIKAPVPASLQSGEAAAPASSQPAEQPAAPATAKTSFAAAAAGVLSLGTGSAWVGFAIIIIIALAVYAASALVRKKRKNLGKKK